MQDDVHVFTVFTENRGVIMYENTKNNEICFAS